MNTLFFLEILGSPLKEKKKSKKSSAMEGANDEFMIKPSEMPAKTFSSDWPLLLKVMLFLC